METKSYIVLKDKTQALTNKTIDADNNVIANLEGDNFKTQATTEVGKVLTVKEGGTVGFVSPSSNFLPTTGGLMSGTISTKATPAMRNEVDTSSTVIRGGTANSYCAKLELNGGSKSSEGGAFFLTAGSTNANQQVLAGRKDGTLKWNDNNVLIEGNAVGLAKAELTWITRTSLMNPMSVGDIKEFPNVKFTVDESPDGSADTTWNVEIRKTDSNIGSITCWGLDGSIWTSGINGDSWTAWKKPTYGEFVSLGKTSLTGQTRAGLMSALSDGETKIITNMRFTAEESPNGSATSIWSVEVHKLSSYLCGITATGLDGTVYTTGIDGESWYSWKKTAYSEGDGVWHDLTTHIHYCKKNGYVTVIAEEFTIPIPTSGHVSVLGTLPVGYRPAAGIEVKGIIMKTYGQEFYGMFWSSSDGNLCAWNTTGAPVALGFRAFLSFPVA